MAGEAGTDDMVDASIALALSSLAIYGLTQVIAKAAVSSLDSMSMVAVNFLVSIPIYVFLFICAIVLWGGYLDHLEYVLYGLVGASTARGGYYIYLEALERGSVSMVGSITAAFPAITAVLAVTFLGERLGLVNGAGIAIIITSMVALSLVQGGRASGSGMSRAALLLSLTTLCVWGFGGIFIKMALEGLPLMGYLGLYVFVLPPVAFAFLRHKGATRRVLFPRYTVPIIGAIVVAELWQLGYFAETAAISEGAASIVFPLISAYPIVTIVGARLWLKESLSRRELAILAFVVLGMVMASVA